MGFLIRMAFWFSLVLLFIPFEISDGEGRVVTVGPIQAFFAAKGAVDDIAGMCERKPDVCAVGRAAAHTVAVRAREGARMAYQALDGYDADESDDPVAEMIAQSADENAVTGSVPTTN